MSKNKSTFNETEFITKLVELGYEAIPVNLCGAEFTMDQDEFYDKYMSDNKYKIAYNTGRNKAVREILAKLKAAADKGEFKAMEYMLTSVYSMKGEVAKSTTATTVERKVVKKKNGLEHLFDPSRIKLDD